MDSRSSAKMSSARELEDDRPVPGHIPDIDYEDDPPGAYLDELRAGRWTITWSLVNLLLLALVALLWCTGAVEPDAAARVPAELVWSLLPASGAIAFIISGWLLLLEVPSGISANAKWSVALAALSLFGWLVLRYACGVIFAEAPE